MRAVFEGLQCNCPPGSHATIQGSIDGIQLSKCCQHYTPDLCDKIAEGGAADCPVVSATKSVGTQLIKGFICTHTHTAVDQL